PITGELYESIRDQLSDVQITDEWINDLLWNTQFLSPDNHAQLDYQLLIAYKESQPDAFHIDLDDDPAPFWRPSATVNAYIDKELMEDGVYTFDFTTQLEHFTPKVLILASGNNTLVGKEFQELQAMKFPTAEVKVVPDCGHNLMWSKPSETQAFIRSYLAEID
ncbi:MAG: alpha/beta hydrolase, partial [Candidatus Neomarinimicrobiota bacterium]